MIFCPVWTNGVSRQSLALFAFRGSLVVWQVRACGRCANSVARPAVPAGQYSGARSQIGKLRVREHRLWHSRKRVWLGVSRSGDDVWSPSVTARAFVILDGRAGASVLPVSVAMGRPPTPCSQEVLTLGGRWDAVGYAQ